jgi:hypothetical protein
MNTCPNNNRIITITRLTLMIWVRAAVSCPPTFQTCRNRCRVQAVIYWATDSWGTRLSNYHNKHSSTCGTKKLITWTTLWTTTTKSPSSQSFSLLINHNSSHSSTRTCNRRWVTCPRTPTRSTWYTTRRRLLSILPKNCCWIDKEENWRSCCSTL